MAAQKLIEYRAAWASLSLRISLRCACGQRWAVPVSLSSHSDLLMKGGQLTVFAANQSHRENNMTMVGWILDEAKKAQPDQA
ncbi:MULTISPECIES: hypothetical protein [unclassified Caballeronia]|uniref:hypothetical protein n=1 Tax=unclassified Caballeronia TaxID=2646786 RepID=UPI0013EA518A|nr:MULTISPECIES: hypothetical protein [unclassified Caballeronia]